jgi:hypothetical protein
LIIINNHLIYFKKNFFVNVVTRKQFASTKDIELLEKKQERIQAEQAQTDLQINSIKDQFKYHQNNLEIQTSKLKETNEIVYKLDNIQIPAINTHLSQMASKEDLINLKREHDIQVKLLKLEHPLVITLYLLFFFVVVINVVKYLILENKILKIF